MPRKLPQKPKIHSNSSIALRNLRHHFINCVVSKHSDVESGIEYGLDWIVEIVEGSNVIGLQFGVQSKVITSRRAIKGGFITQTMRVSTLEYLSNASLPVYLHFYHEPSQRAYMMDFQDWYIRNHESQWEQQETVSVRIPLTELLNEEMVKRIKGQVARHWRDSNLQRAIRLSNESSVDHKVTMQIDGKNTSVKIESVNDSSIPEINILDMDAASSIQRAIDTGLPTPFRGNIRFSNIPKEMSEIVNSWKWSDFHVELILPTHLVRFQFLDKSGKILLETKVIEMHPIQKGAVNRKWKGTLARTPIIYELEDNLHDKSRMLNVTLDHSERNPLVIAKYFHMVDIIRKSDRIVIIDAQTEDILFESPSHHFSRINGSFEWTRRLVNALVSIQDKTSIQIPMPDEINDAQLSHVERIAHILSTGIYEGLIGANFPDQEFVLMLTGNRTWAQEVYSALEKEGEEDYFAHEGEPEMYATVFDHQIPLGPCEYVFQDIHLVNRDEVISEINNIDESEEDKSITLIFSFDRQRSYTRFPKWQVKSE